MEREPIGPDSGAVEADPAFVPANDGLLARIRALKTLTTDPWTFMVVLLLEVFFAGVELAAVLPSFSASFQLHMRPAWYARISFVRSARAERWLR